MTARHLWTSLKKAGRRDLAVGVALFLLALLLRLYEIDAAPPGLNGDELFNLIDARRIKFDHLPVFFPGNNGREAFYFYLLALSVRLLGATVLALRLPPVLLGSGVTLLTYLVGRDLFDRRVGAVGGALVAVSFWPVMLSRMGLRAISLPFLATLTVLFFYRALQNGRLRYWLAGGVSLGLTLYTYIPARVFPLVIVGWLGWVWWRRRAQLVRNSRALIFSIIVAVLVFAPFGLYMVRFPEHTNQRIASMANALDRARAGEPQALLGSVGGVLKMFSIEGDEEWRYHLAHQPVFDPVTSLFFYAGVVICLISAFRACDSRTKQAEYALLLLWMGAMLAPNAVLNENPSFIRAAGAIVPVYLITGIGASRLVAWGEARWHASRWVSSALICAGLLAILTRTTHDYFRVWVNHPQVQTVYHAGQALMGRYLEAEQPPAGTRVFIAYDYVYDNTTALSLALFTDEEAAWFARTNTFPWAGSGDEQGNAWYLLPADQQLPADVLNRLRQRADEEIVEFANGDEAFTVYKVSGEVLALEPQYEAGLQFDNGLQLTGYDMRTPLIGGETLDLRLHWEVPPTALPQINRLTYVQVHVADVAGIVRARDEALLGFPQAGWVSGDRFVQDIEVEMPAGMLPGPATLAFGLRDDGGEAVGSMQQAPGETAQVVRSRPVAAFAVTEEMTVFDDTLALTGATFRPVATPGAALNVELAWMPLREPEQDYRIRLVLVDGASGAEVVAQTFGLWPDLYPPTQWRTLEPVTTLHGLRIPVDFEASAPLELRVEALPGQGRGDGPVPSSGAGAELGMVEVDVRKRIFELPQLAQRVDAQFGDAIHLAGYELDTSQARPGGSVMLTLVWQAIKTPDDNYTVFNHLVGEDGLNAGQFDAPPVGEAWLTETWLPGEVVVEEREIPIDEAAVAGEVQLIVGLYNADDLQRLPVVLNGEPQAGDQLLLDRFLISAAAVDQP